VSRTGRVRHRWRRVPRQGTDHHRTQLDHEAGHGHVGGVAADVGKVRRLGLVDVEPRPDLVPQRLGARLEVVAVEGAEGRGVSDAASKRPRMVSRGSRGSPELRAATSAWSVASSF